MLLDRAQQLRLEMGTRRSAMLAETTRSTFLPIAAPPRLFDGYALHPTAWDELFAEPDVPRPHCRSLVEWLGFMEQEQFLQRRRAADWIFINRGITFSVYSDRRGVEKIFPFDLIPRPVDGKQWQID